MSQSDQPNAPLSDFLPYMLSVASNAVSSRIAEQYRSRFGLSTTEWRIIAVLGDSGELTQRELARLTLMDKVAVNRACGLLEKRAVVERAANMQDRRSHHLRLTEEGRSIHARIMPLARAIEAELFGSFDEGEREALRGLLDRVRRSAVALDSSRLEG